MRRQGRICALQILYQLDLNKQLYSTPATPLHALKEAEVGLQNYFVHFEPVEAEERQFAERLVYGVVRALYTLDTALQKAAQHWRLDRMDVVDRNILRVAAYEMLMCPDIPRSVAINEAIEVSKRFAGQDSASFINGVLDQLHDSGQNTSSSDISSAE